MEDIKDKIKACEFCEGTGRLVPIPLWLSEPWMIQHCPSCGGTGKAGERK